MHWLSIIPVTHALKPTFQNKLSHFFGYSSRLEKLNATNQPSCDLEDLQPISKTTTEPSRSVGKPLQSISEQSTALEVLCNHSAKHQLAAGTVCNQLATHQPPLLESQKYRSLKPFVNAF
jgi:hypothetical protein